jgi:hypothetical protein
MFLQFDKNRMHLQVIAGVLEKYEPTPAILEIHRKIEDLRTKLSEFQKAVVIPAMEELEKEIGEQNKPHLRVEKATE